MPNFENSEEIVKTINLARRAGVIATPHLFPDGVGGFAKNYFDTALAAARSTRRPDPNDPTGFTNVVDLDLINETTNPKIAQIFRAVEKAAQGTRFR